jgi:ATP-dependent Clp protease ATP-binding subunit ClpA
MADKTPEEIKAAAAAAAAQAEAKANEEAKAKAEADLKAKTEQAAADKDAAQAAQEKAKLSALAVTPNAIAKLVKDAAGHPPIAVGERRMFIPVHSRIQNPLTLQWFEDQAVKATVDDWIIGQYYAEEPRLRLSED